MTRKRKSEKGYFLIMMFFIMVILSALAASYSSFVIKQLQFARILEQDILLRQIAESGVRYGHYYLKKDMSFRKTPYPVPCGEGTFQVYIFPRDKFYIIKIKAIMNEQEKEIERIYYKEKK